MYASGMLALRVEGARREVAEVSDNGCTCVADHLACGAELEGARRARAQTWPSLADSGLVESKSMSFGRICANCEQGTGPKLADSHRVC